jgi:hypothetical protein
MYSRLDTWLAMVLLSTIEPSRTQTIRLFAHALILWHCYTQMDPGSPTRYCKASSALTLPIFPSF